MMKDKIKGNSYSIPQIDLSIKPKDIDTKFDYLYKYITVEHKGHYLGHPDSILLKNGKILAFFPEGHGKGRVLSKISVDGGKTFTDEINNPPKSWANSRETPTVFRLQFNQRNIEDKLILISGNPLWNDESKLSEGGFNCSISNDEGNNWSEFELFHKDIYPIVAMSSLVKLKENGKFVDRWMGLFHDSEYHNYKTILTFDEKGKMLWTKPELYFNEYRDEEKISQMCEVMCIRSDCGYGDELCLITRSNSKNVNSMISFSKDEGLTWTYPIFAPASLNGERHKALYLSDGRLIITFRSIERDENKINMYKDKYNVNNNWISEGWIAWIGKYEDLKLGSEGQYRIKLAHTFLPNQTFPESIANADCGYSGNVILSDGSFLTMTYGIFNADKNRDTFIAAKKINIKDIDLLIERTSKNIK